MTNDNGSTSIQRAATSVHIKNSHISFLKCLKFLFFAAGAPPCNSAHKYLFRTPPLTYGSP